MGIDENVRFHGDSGIERIQFRGVLQYKVTAFYFRIILPDYDVLNISSLLQKPL